MGKFKQEEIEMLAKQYAEQEDFNGFVNGFKKALEIIEKVENAPNCRCSNGLEASNCGDICKRCILESYDL